MSNKIRVAEDCQYTVRNDMVLVRMENIGQKDGIHIPQTSAEGKRYIVVAIGQDVKDLDVGDRVQVVGQQGVDFDFLPFSGNLFIICERMVPLVYRKVSA